MIILCVFLLFFLSIFIATMVLGISPMPTSVAMQKQLLKVLPENIEGDIIDLGSGFGSMLFFLAKKYPKARIIGYERSPFVYLASKTWVFCAQKKQIKVYFKSIYSADLSKASMVFCYLFPKAMEKLEARLKIDTNLGALIATHTFRIPNWKPYSQYVASNLYQDQIYFYKKES